MSKAIFAGSFDPWQNGHMDRLTNALKIFDRVIIVVADNETKKSYWFHQEERAKLIQRCVAHLGKQVAVKTAGTKMLHDICHEEGIFNVFRGIKSGRTFEEEFRLQVVCKYLAKQEYGEELLFVYDVTSEDDFRGSSIVKKLLLANKDASSLVPDCIIADLKERAKCYE